MKFTHILSIITISIITATTAITAAPAGTVELGLTFGEIPILSGSFKPGISAGYHYNEYLYIGGVFQLVDNLQRDGESYNAQNTKLGGIIRSKESVGERILLQARITPVKMGPYVSVGWVYNYDDVETMTFDSRERTIGMGTYTGPVTIKQTRKQGGGFGMGLGYQYDFDSAISLNTDFTMAFMSDIPTPEIEFLDDPAISDEDKTSFRQVLQNELKNNFHNHYHVFNLGVSYRFENLLKD